MFKFFKSFTSQNSLKNELNNNTPSIKENKNSQMYGIIYLTFQNKEYCVLLITNTDLFESGIKKTKFNTINDYLDSYSFDMSDPQQQNSWHSVTGIIYRYTADMDLAIKIYKEKKYNIRKLFTNKVEILVPCRDRYYDLPSVPTPFVGSSFENIKNLLKENNINIFKKIGWKVEL
jgi:hypothetical protein